MTITLRGAATDAVAAPTASAAARRNGGTPRRAGAPGGGRPRRGVLHHLTPWLFLAAAVGLLLLFTYWPADW